MNLTINIQDGKSFLDVCSFIVELLSYFSTFLTVTIGAYAVWFAKKEYLLHKKEEKARTLAQYNERYSSNEHLLIVVEYLWEIQNRKEEYEKKLLDKKNYKEIQNEIEIECKNNKKARLKIPTEHDKELFLRFFEEMQYSIEQETLDEEQVKDLFYYYAKIANDMGCDFVDDFDKNCWRKFKVFIKNMKYV